MSTTEGGQGVDASAALKADLIQRIKQKGPIPFAEFMQESLYGPLGFFSAGRVRIGGKYGDRSFTTTPEKSTLYNQLVGTNFYDFWGALGQPTNFPVVEMGAGNGTMAWGILKFLKTHIPDLYDAVQYHIVEVSPAFAQIQRVVLSDEPVNWIVGSAVDCQLPKVRGVFLSNELVDNLPFHRVIKREGQLKEIYVWEEGGKLVELRQSPSTARLGLYLQEEGVQLEEGQEACISLVALKWLAHISSALEKGFIITIDYGDTADKVYNPKGGWHALTQYGFSAIARETNERIMYALPGSVDITAPVDFTALMLQGRKVGLEVEHFSPRGMYLGSLGLNDVYQSLITRAKLDPLNINDYAQKIAEVRSLLHSPGYQVLIQKK